jgi:hypothetical protein
LKLRKTKNKRKNGCPLYGWPFLKSYVNIKKRKWGSDMIDAHVHIEHSHRFSDFINIYDSILENKDCGEYQREWLSRKSELRLSDYKDFINEMRKYKFPIEISFGHYPSSDFTNIYESLATALKESEMKAEFSNGLYINYGHKELGLNTDLLKILLDNNVQIVTASDAHRPEDVGKYIMEAKELIYKLILNRSTT